METGFGYIPFAKVKSFIERTIKSPKFRLGATIIGTIVVSIVANIYAFQIAPNGVIAWSKLTQVSAFWPLVVIVVIWLYTNIAFLRHDQNIQRFADDDYCVAFVRYTNLEAYAQEVKADPTKVRDARIVLKELKVKK